MKTYSLATNISIEQLTISDVIYSKEDAESGNPYNTTAIIEVISCNFSGVSKFEFDIKDFKEFIININKAYNELNGSVTLNDICYGGEITFEFEKTGHVNVSGKIFDHGMEQELRFKFTTDQTAFLKFTKDLQRGWIE